MGTIKAIESIGNVNDKLALHSALIQAQIISITGQWEGMKKIGGVRPDHAATLLALLRKEMSALETFAHNVVTQLDDWQKNPFQD